MIMPRRAPAPAFAALALVLVALLIAACHDDVAGPEDPSTRPTMANLWPHADSTGWTYDLELASWDGIEPGAGAGLPSDEELHDLILETPASAPDTTISGEYSLRFEGNLTTLSGITGQQLVERFTESSGVTRSGGDATARLLRALARARPGDARVAAALDAHPGALAKAVDVGPRPNFLAAYAFAAEDTGYYGYGDMHTQHSWVYLEGPVEAGATFTLQLMPMWFDDLWLRGRIWSVGSRTIDGRRWRNVVEVLYVLDLGEQAVTDEEGNLLGWFHNYMSGIVLYAPGTGPIACDERQVYGPSEIIQDEVTGGVATYRCSFTGTITP